MNELVHESVAQYREDLAQATINWDAVRHFWRYRHKAPNWILNRMGPWNSLSDEDVEADAKTADWVPNRAMWRARGFKGMAHAQAVLSG